MEREYALGRGRTDLLVTWPYKGGVQTMVLELKLLHKALEETIQEGVAQTYRYMDRCRATEGHLLIFDRRPGQPWETKLFRQEEMYQGHLITVWGQ